MCVQNNNFGFVFGTFLAPVWPYHLEIARCKTTVNLLSYGIGIIIIMYRFAERWQLGADVRTGFGLIFGFWLFSAFVLALSI